MEKEITFELEVTQRCNNNCLFCYNVWKSGSDYPRGELSAREMLPLLKKVIGETGCRHFVLTGGEPLLREDIFGIIGFLARSGAHTALVTNGTLLTDETAIKCIDAGVELFEIPLLDTDADIHDYLSGADSHRAVVNAIGSVRRHGGKAVAVFVATSRNIGDARRTAESAFAAGAAGMKFNRFNPGGEGLRHLRELMPSKSMVETALAQLDSFAAENKAEIFSPLPIQPCLIDKGRYKNLRLDSYCTAGSYYTIDALGNVRMCSHSPTILGNLKFRSFLSMSRSRTALEFIDAYPAECGGCPHIRDCRGGCKAAAEVSSGSIYDPDPVIACWNCKENK